MAAFTDEQKAWVRFHLGYAAGDRIVSLFGGTRSNITGETYAVDKSLEVLNEAGKPIVLDLLGKLQDIRTYMHEAAGSAEADSMGDLKLNPMVEARHQARYRALQLELANHLGVTTNQWAQQGSGLNARWSR